MKKYLIALLLGAMAFLVACDDDDNSKPAASRFTVPEAVVDGTTATVSSLADFDGLENLDRGFYYAPITSAGTGEFTHTSAPLVDGAKMSATLVGLDAQTSYKFYAYVVMADGLRYESERAEFKTGDKSSTVVPTFESLAATNVEPTTATINATLAYTGSETIAEVYFLTTIDGAQVRKDVEVTVGTKSAALTELKASTEYKFQLVAKIGGVTYASDMTSFTTKTDDPSVVEPTFEGLSSSNVTATSATLSGTFGYTGTKQITAVYFEYKTATGAAQRKDVGSLTAGAKSVDLTGLTASTTYTYNLCVVIDGEIYKDAENNNFTTTAAVDPSQKPRYTGWVELLAEEENNSDLMYAYYDCAGKPQGKRNYTVCYSKEMAGPIWVAYPMHSIYQGGTKRTDAWQYGPVISQSWQPNLKSSYDKDASIYNGKPFKDKNKEFFARGHMIASGDRTSSDGTNRQTFYYTNMSPQIQNGFNGGIWEQLEGGCRSMICSDTLYMVTGAYYANKDSYTADKSGKRVIVPTNYYKVLIRSKSGSTGKALWDLPADQIECAAYWFDHKVYSGSYSNNITTVADVEAKTGQKFFLNVPNAPKGKVNKSFWK